MRKFFSVIHNIQERIKRVMKLPQGISFEECNVENFFHHLCESMNVMPVSYTHLDVYKRQVIGRMAI